MDRQTLSATCLLAGALVLAGCGGAASAPLAATAGSIAPADPGSTPAPSATPAPQAAAPASVDPVAASPAPVAQAPGPVDVCAMLSTSDVATIVPDATTEAADAGAGPVAQYGCSWTAGTASNGIPASLSVTVAPNFISQSQAASGLAPEMVKQIASGAATNDGGSVIDGLGDLGVVDPVSHLGPQVTFFAGDAMVQLDYTASDGLAKQDAVVDVARLVAGRLP
jgi:hypothetical protein